MAKGGILCFILFAKLLQAKEAPVDEKETLFAAQYLKEYHYLSPLKDGNHNLEDAVRMFQEHTNIPNTGILDRRTMKEMHKPRCGVPDMDEQETSGRKKRFSTSGHRWPKSHLTYKFTNYSTKGGLNQSQQRNIMAKAFSQWEAISQLTFQDVTTIANSNADIKISFNTEKHGNCAFYFEGVGGSLAHAYYPDDGIVHFDDDEVFTDGVPTGTNFFSVALHEIGHLLGLTHSVTSSAIMYPTYKSYNASMALTIDEKNGIEYIYAGGTARPDSALSTKNCTDLYEECPKYVNSCSISLESDSMKKNCPKTCGLCGGQSVGTPCTDKIKTKGLCKYWKDKTLCGSQFVVKRCKKTCQKCT